jgi:hypothetical protein
MEKAGITGLFLSNKNNLKQTTKNSIFYKRLATVSQSTTFQND